MNLKNAIFLLNPNLRCVAGIYEAQKPGQSEPTRTLYKTFDPEVKVGDLVMVPSGTRHNVTVVKIVGVDIEFDPDSNQTIDWVIGPVDLDPYTKLLAQEEEAVAIIRSAEKRRRAEDLKKAIFLDSEDKLKALPIAALGEAPALDKPKN